MLPVRRSLRLLTPLVVSGHLAWGQTASQTVSFQVNAINQISLSGSPSLSVTAATAGSGPSSVVSSTANWSVTTNQSGAKVVGHVGTLLPTGVTLSVALAAPTGALSTGTRTLTTADIDLVTGLTKQSASGLAVTYQLDATDAAGPVSSDSRVVTYTITGGA